MIAVIQEISPQVTLARRAIRGSLRDSVSA